MRWGVELGGSCNEHLVEFIVVDCRSESFEGHGERCEILEAVRMMMFPARRSRKGS